MRQRRDDVPLLASHFMAKVGGDRRLEITDRALAELRRRPWHGNVRELRNAVEHAAVVARGGMIDAEHLPPAHAPVAGSAPQGAHAAGVRAWRAEAVPDPALAAQTENAQVYERFQRTVDQPLLESLLRMYDDNLTIVASVLGIHRSTLRQKLRDLGLR